MEKVLKVQVENADFLLRVVSLAKRKGVEILDLNFTENSGLYLLMLKYWEPARNNFTRALEEMAAF